MAANEFNTARRKVSTAIGLLKDELTLPLVCTRFADAEFSGKVGSTVDVDLPALAESSDYADAFDEHTTSITRSNLVERSIPVTLNKMPISAVPLTSENQTLDVDNFGARVLAPQAQTVGERIEGYVAATLAGANFAEDHEIGFNEEDPWGSIVEARRLLNVAKVPRGDRFLVVGSDVEAAMLADKDFVLPGSVGEAGALHEATIGRRAGFTIVGSNAIDPSEAYAMHRSAIILATVAPTGPGGGAATAAASYGGLALRWAEQWNPDTVVTESVVWAFAGCRTVADAGAEGDEVVRAVKLDLDLAGS